MSSFALIPWRRARGAIVIAAIAAAGFVLGQRAAPRSPARVHLGTVATVAPAAPAATPRQLRCAVDLPPADPHPARPAELATVDWLVVARIPVLGPDGAPGREAIVRALDGGWCLLVPAGPPITFTVADGWVWFARAAAAGASAPVTLDRVAIDGGGIQHLADLARLPDLLSAIDGRLLADYPDGLEALVAIDDVLGSAPDVAAAPVAQLPPVVPRPNRSPAVIRAYQLARIGVADYSFDEQVVRTTPGGWCVIVPPGPPLEMTVADGWLYVVRAESSADGAPIWLSRVPVTGGPMTRLALVPSMPDGIYHRNGAIAGRAERRGAVWWVEVWPYEPVEPPAGGCVSASPA